MQQSAVKWLEDQIKSKHWKEMFIWQKEEVFKKAKEMQNERLTEAYRMGRIGKSIKEFKETFKSE